ncbi:unnamed protein product [Gadus morhua 'NCC']
MIHFQQGPRGPDSRGNGGNHRGPAASETPLEGSRLSRATGSRGAGQQHDRQAGESGPDPVRRHVDSPRLVLLEQGQKPPRLTRQQEEEGVASSGFDPGHRRAV